MRLPSGEKAALSTGPSCARSAAISCPAVACQIGLDGRVRGSAALEGLDEDRAATQHGHGSECADGPSGWGVSGKVAVVVVASPLRGGRSRHAYIVKPDYTQQGP
jgi:hypothetical protein